MLQAYVYAEFKSHVLKFWRPGPKGRKMAAKKVGVFVTGTMSSHIFVKRDRAA